MSNSVARLHEAMSSGTTSAVAAVEECLSRIDVSNGRINAVVTLDAASARRQAEVFDREPVPDPVRLPLRGVPITVKDAFATAGMRTTASHPPLADYVPDTDATVVARLRQAGAIILGKTNLSRLAGDPQCISPVFGATRNPWCHDATPGGSSGGAAAAVAMGFSHMDPGSDLGGSIRIPAAFCGVYGLKATENRIPRTGHIPHLPGQPRSVRHMLSFGVLTRSIEDLALGLSVLAGPDRFDTEVPPVVGVAGRARSDRLRVAWWDDFAGLPLCDRTRTGLDRAIGRLTDAGVDVVRRLPDGFDPERALYAYGVLAGAEIGLAFRPWERHLIALAGRLIPRRQTLTRAFTHGLRFDWRRYNAALNIRDQLISAMEDFLDDHDVLICPTAPRTAYPAFALKPLGKPPTLAVGDRALPFLEATVSMVGLFSLTGHPVVSLPAGLVDGLPVGLQCVGRRWGDEALIEACAQIDHIVDGYASPPASSG